LKRKMTLILALAVLLTTAGATFAQEMSSTAAIATAIAKQKTGDKTTDGLRKEIVRLKYVRAIYIKDFLYPFASREGHVVSNPETPDILALSDLPENIEKMLAAIREIDVKPPDVLFTVQLVMGSETEATTDAELQGEPVIKELRKLLRYKGYTLLDATMVRGMDRERAEIVMGRKAEFQLEIRPEVAREKPLDNINLKLRLVQVLESPVMKDGKVDSSAKDLIRSQLNLKSGDKAVVGVSKLDGGDKGLILIVSAKVVE
jgi:hypothetical protein